MPVFSRVKQWPLDRSTQPNALFQGRQHNKISIKEKILKRLILSALLGLGLFGSSARSEVAEITITRGDGVGFLPLNIMEQQKLIEQRAEQAGVKLVVKWVNISGSGVINDALLSGSAHFISGGPPGMLTLWDRAKGKIDVRGVGAISAQPMYLNTRAPHLRSIDDISANDKIAVTSVKISIPSIIMQMHARRKYGVAETYRFDPFTVAYKHPDGVASLLSGGQGITAHFTSPPFHQRERKDPSVRTIMTSNDVMGGATTFAMMVATEAFQKQNPIIVKSVSSALQDAHAFISKDKRAAAGILMQTLGTGWDAAEVLAILDDPDVNFTLTPQNIKTYADFMVDIGSLKNRPNSWKDVFFEHIHDLPGS
jgi:NitT/TauT family transport system substrate-binding protein